MTGKRRREKPLSLHPMNPDLALRRALNTPSPTGAEAIRCAACGKAVKSPREMSLKRGVPYHVKCLAKARKG